MRESLLVCALTVLSIRSFSAPVRSTDGIWTVPAACSEALSVMPESNGKVPSVMSVWSNGKSAITAVRNETSNCDGIPHAFRVTTDGGLLAVQVGHPFDIEDSVLEFRYRLSEKTPVVSLGASLRVKEWANRLVGIRLVPTYGTWRTESFPLACLMQGDTWRLGNAQTASSVEIGVIGKDKGVSLDLAFVRIVRRPTAFSPKVRPEWLVGSGVYRRSFRIVGKPEKSWLMAYGQADFSVSVNGRRIGSGPVSTDSDGWKTRGMLNPAADQWSLDGSLVEGTNAVDFALNGGSKKRGMVVLGWISEGRQNVIVSDGAWFRGTEPAQTEALPWEECPLELDVYPLRPSDTWREPVCRPDYSSVSSYSPTNRLLQVRPEAGKWGMERNAVGRWYFRSPSGHPFFYYGIQTVNAFWPNYGYADWARRAYADETDWAKDAVGLVSRLGFNGIGVAATAGSAFRAAAARGMVNLEHIGCADGAPQLVNARGEIQWGVADPFDPEFRRVLRKRLAEYSAAWLDRTDVFAICVGNEALIEGNILDRPSSGYVYSKACGNEFVLWLKVRYRNDLAALNAAWFGGLESKFLASFEDVLVRKPDPYMDVPRVDDPEYAAALAHLGKAKTVKVKESRMKDDFDAFAVRVVGEYAETTLACMREAFPEKLIVSNRFMGGATREMYACWKNYDAIAVNTYPLDTWGDAVFNERKVRLLCDAHEATGKPVLLTEWGVQGMDVNMQSPAAQLYTQAERGRGYEKVLRQVVETMPFVVGVVDFGFQHIADTEGQGWGIVDNRGRPYREYLDGMLSAVRWLDGYLK